MAASGIVSGGSGPSVLEIPLYFERYAGQTPRPTQFVLRGAGYEVDLAPGGTTFVVGRGFKKGQSPPVVLTMQIVGGRKSASMEGLEVLPGKSNYLVGNDRSKWITDLPQYGKLRVRDVYPGIDVVYRPSDRKLEYDFVVGPGAKPSRIRLRFGGSKALRIDKGDLVLSAGGVEIRHKRPRLYQEFGDGERNVEGAYRLVSRDTVEFAVGAYDTTRPLVIDPEIVFSTYLIGTGGAGTGVYMAGSGVTMDNAGNVYSVGDGIGVASRDIYVVKFGPTGTMLYTTSFGSVTANDYAAGIAVTAGGSVAVIGYTSAPNYPTANPAQATFGGVLDAVVTKLTPGGNAMTFSTYLGGSEYEHPMAIAMDGNGNVYASGRTYSTNFPTSSPAQGTLRGAGDAFVTKFNSSGSIIYSTYLGGSEQSNTVEDPLGIAADASGNAYVTGHTNSNNFPVLNALQPSNAGAGSDAYVTKFNAVGGMVYSTYLGGSSGDFGTAIAVDAGGNAYITGGTGSANFPIANAIYSTITPPGPGACQALPNCTLDAFVTKINAAGSAIVFSTYLGGSAVDQATGIAVNSGGNAYISGYTYSTDFPLKDALQGYGGNGDTFVVKLNTAGTALIYSTYLGGTGSEAHSAIAVNDLGAAVGGSTLDSGFPTVNAQWPTWGGSNGFAAKINDLPLTTCTLSVNPTSANWPASGGIGSFSVNTSTGFCGWMAVSNAAWLTVGTPNGTGNGTVSYSVSINTTSQSRTGTIFVNGVPFTVTQAGTVCSYQLISAGETIAGGGGTGSVLMLAGGGSCAWTAVSNASWITITSATSGQGNATISYSASANPTTAQRTGTITVQGLTFTVTQGAGIPCTFQLALAGVNVGSAGGTGAVGLTASGTACSWAVVSNAAWITVLSAASGQGNTGVAYSVAANTGPRRIGTITIAGQTFTLTQTALLGPTKIGTYNVGQWKLDSNGNGTFDAATDRSFFLGFPGATQFTGDWNGDGKTKAGVYSNGYWFLDYDGNGVWDNGVIDKLIAWGWAGATPFVGDWNGDGKTKIGVYSNGFWFLDYNGNYLWEPAGADKQVGWGWAGVTPFVGDWNGDGKTKIGVYSGGYWYLDYDGDYLWQYPATDKIWALGWAGTTPVIGDWSGDGKSKVGAFINGFWYLDYNGSGAFDGAITDRIFAFGAAGDTPVVGRW